jgi:Protein of unknown function (DUF2924)
LITDVFRSRSLLCTIHHLINFTPAGVENVPVVPAVLDKGHQRETGRLAGTTYRSLTEIAFAMTGTRWSGPRFFGLRTRAEKPA